MCAPLLDAALPRKSTPVCNLSAPPATLTRRIGQVVVAEVINQTFEQMFREIMEKAFRPVRQIRIAMFNLERLDTQPTLWGTTAAERWGCSGRCSSTIDGTTWQKRIDDRLSVSFEKTRFSTHHTEGQMSVYTATRDGAEFVWRELALNWTM